MEGCLVVVPTKRRIRHLTREIMRLSPGAVAPALPLHTMESLCRALYAAAPGAGTVLGGPPRTLLFHRAVRSVAGDLMYFSLRGKDRQLPRGIFDRLIDVITALKESGIYHDILAEELALSSPGEQPKLADVASIYAAYERELAALDAEDLEGIYRVLSLIMPPGDFAYAFRRLFPGVETLSLAGFDEFSVPEVRIIRRICALPGLSVTMMFDYLKGNPGLFGHLEENYRLFTELGFREAGGEKEASAAAFFFGFAARPPVARRAAEHIARRLFSPGDSRAKADLRGSVTILAARSRVHEVECCCKLVKRLVADRPARDLSAICIALHNPGKYTDVMRELFAEYEIPVNITDRYELARSPLTVALLGLLRLPLHGFRRQDVLRVAGSPYITVPVSGTPFDAGNLSAVALQVRATAGLGGWLGRIERAREEADRLLGGAADEADKRHASVRVQALRKARTDMESLGSVLTPFESELTAAEFENELLSLMDRTRVLSNLIDPGLRGTPELMEKDVRAFNAFRDTLHAVAMTARLQDGPDVRQGLRVHFDRLKTALGQERYNVREAYGRGVLVTSIEETRELPVEVMIVAGLVDGEFPSVYQPEVFLSARRRRERERRHAWENRYLFYQAATNWTEHLYLTYPLREGENELVRSSFVDAFLKSSEVTLWEDPEEIPFARDICSRAEYLSRHGSREGDAPIPEPLLPGMEEEWARVRISREVERDRRVGPGSEEYGGIIAGAAGEEGRRHLEGFRDRVFSISQLETYAGCPFRFFSRSLLGLHEREEFEEGMTPVEKGALLHDSLYEFFSGRRGRNAPSLKGALPVDFEQAVKELVAIASLKMESLDIPDVFWDIEKELILGRGTTGEGLLRRFLENERGRDDAMEPGYFEVSFGGTAGIPGTADRLLSRPEPVTFGGARLRGRIDRIDTGDGFFAVMDYKTGRDVPGLSDIREGVSLQLPAYIFAAEALLGGVGGLNLAPAGGFYYRLRDEVELKPALVTDDFRGRAFPAGSRSRQIVRDEAEFREIIGETARFVGSMLEGIAGGRFPLTRPELVRKLCGHCGFRTVCRIQSLKHVTPESPEEQ
jgi:ATP-dependent helicase/nuclease subunit B